MDQELLFKAQFLQKQAEELEQNLAAIDNELSELQKIDSNLDFLAKSKEKSSISSIGKGLHIKTNIDGKELFVEVGAGVVVKKSPEEARKIIELQVKKLNEAKMHVLGKLDIYHRTIESVVMELEEKEKHAHAGHKH